MLQMLRKELNEILYIRLGKAYFIEDMVNSYKELIRLKEKLINISRISLNQKDVEELGYIFFRTIEEIYFVEIDLREADGLDSSEIYKKLVTLYYCI